MTLWRRLLRFLARKEIEREVDKALAVHRSLSARALFEMAVKAEIGESLAHARGVMEGATTAFEAVEAAIAERMGGGEDLVQEKDVENAKGRLLH